MGMPLENVRAWKTWLAAGTVSADHSALDLDPSDGASGQMINVYPYTAIILRMFGKDTNNDTASMEIVGRMDDSTKNKGGRGQSLWKGQVILGSISSSFIPLDDGKWSAAATWFEVDTYDEAGVSGGHNACKAITIGGGNQALLILPTIGYNVLEMVVTDIGGSSPEMTELGALYRFASNDGVI